MSSPLEQGEYIFFGLLNPWSPDEHSRFPTYEVWIQATQSDVAATTFMAAMLVAIFIGLNAMQQTASRMTWSLARDDALLFSNHLSKVHPRLNVPVQALFFNAAIVLLIGCLYMASTLGESQVSPSLAQASQARWWRDAKAAQLIHWASVQCIRCNLCDPAADIFRHASSSADLPSTVRERSSEEESLQDTQWSWTSGQLGLCFVDCHHHRLLPVSCGETSDQFKYE